MDFITAPLVTGIIFYFTYMVFELFVRKNERMTLIEKMGQTPAAAPPLDPSLLRTHFNYLPPSFPKNVFTGLRIGFLLIGLGLGLLVGLFLCIMIRISGIPKWSIDMFYSIALGSSVLLFGGLGLILSYFVERKLAKKQP